MIDDEIKEIESAPVHDPNNKVYFVICVLIGIAVCFGSSVVKGIINTQYSVYCESLSLESKEVVLNELGFDKLPEGISFEFARLQHGFDNDMLYVVLSCENEFIPNENYVSADDEERFLIYPDENLRTDYVYGRLYADSERPERTLILYNYNDTDYCEFRVTGYDSAVKSAMRDGVKTEIVD